MSKRRRPEVGSRGIALEDIAVGETGKVDFPEGDIGEYTVHARRTIRKYYQVIVVDASPGVVEYRNEDVNEFDDYVSLTTGTTEQVYNIGTRARAANPKLPLFEARSLLFLCTQIVLIRFGDALNVQHVIPANTYFTYRRRCSKIYYQQQTLAGTLEIWSEG